MLKTIVKCCFPTTPIRNENFAVLAERGEGEKGWGKYYYVSWKGQRTNKYSGAGRLSLWVWVEMKKNFSPRLSDILIK